MRGLNIAGLEVRHIGPFDLAIAPGECVVLTGPSGTGKSLLLRSVADLVPHRGQVCLNGRSCDLTPPPDWRKTVALLPSESRWWHDRVGEHFHGYDRGQLTRLGLDPSVMDWDVRRLSSGEKQRLALLRLLSNQPAALLLDEPTANLDRENTRKVESLLMDYKTARNVPLLWVSHDAEQSDRIADRRFLLHENRLTPI